MLCMRSPCVIDTRWQGTLLELNLAFLKYLFFRDGEYSTRYSTMVGGEMRGDSIENAPLFMRSRARATSLSILRHLRGRCGAHSRR